MEVFSLWIGKTNDICRTCIKSWIKLDYKVIIYVDLNNYDTFFNSINVQLKDYKEILDIEHNNICVFSDYFRFLRLYKHGGIWLDSDEYLLRKLPDLDIIISSERAAQLGAYKNKLKEIANIGVLKFPIGDPLMKYCINKIETSKSKSDKVQKNMFVFQKALNKSGKFDNYHKYIAPASDYCPVNWSNVKELYYSNEFISKYGKEITLKQDIINTSVAVHLWNSLSNNKYKINFSQIEESSLYYFLRKKVEDDIIICIPSFRRLELLKTTTLKLLVSNNITNYIFIFLRDEKDYNNYREGLKDFPLNLNFIMTNEIGIGRTRTFIRDYFKTGTKIIQIDDDIINIKSKRNNFNLNKFFIEMFEVMKKENVKFCGCCPYDNEFFMKEGYTTTLKYTGGHLIAEIIREDPLKVNIDHFEDYVANIEYYIKDKKLLRFNDVYVQTNYFNPTGGIIQSYGNIDKRKNEAEILAKQLELKYPTYCKAYKKKKFNVYNLRLRHTK